jgi:hypothetical protein
LEAYTQAANITVVSVKNTVSQAAVYFTKDTHDDAKDNSNNTQKGNGKGKKNKQKKQEEQSNSETTKPPGGKGSCYLCGNPDHKAYACPQLSYAKDCVKDKELTLTTMHQLALPVIESTQKEMALNAHSQLDDPNLVLLDNQCTEHVFKSECLISKMQKYI